MLEIVVARTPGMQLHYAQLCQTRKRFRCIHRDVRLDLTGLPVGNINATNLFWQRRVHMLLKEARLACAVRATYQTYRPARDMRQKMVSDLPVVVRQHLLGHT
jgi:hypothetical protein